MLKNKNIAVYFGDASSGVVPSPLTGASSCEQLCSREAFEPMAKRLGLSHLVFLNQVHGTAGLCISDTSQLENLKPLGVDGDFIVTNIRNCGIGVMTADCIPLALIDNEREVIAIVHAGWRGLVGNVVQKAVSSMVTVFGSNPENIQAIIGPSAKGCCYEVSEDFTDVLDQHLANQTIIEVEDSLLFDLPMCCCIKLEEAGVPSDSIDLSQSRCTICSDGLLSYRCDGGLERQVSIVSIV